MTALLTSIQAALELPASSPDFTESGALPSAFAVTDLASASLAAVGQAVAELRRQQTGESPGVSVDRRLASFWFASSLRPIGWSLPAPWDPIAGDYATADGMAKRVALWNKGELEQVVIDSGGCAAEMRSWDDWKSHPQGLAVNAEALIQRSFDDDQRVRVWTGSAAQPLAGIKVLDLTRILAGPVASRMLAGLGADVLRIDPPDWEEPSLVPEVTRGKRCARLNLHDSTDRQTFEQLLGEADILLHGYRADALRRATPPATGAGVDRHQPECLWLERPVAQSARFRQPGTDELRNRRRRPALATGGCANTLARTGAGPCHRLATAIRALTERLHSGRGGSARLSLARTAKLLVEHGTVNDTQPLRRETARDRSTWIEYTAWGPAHRLIPPLNIEGTPLHWQLPAGKLGMQPAKW